MAYDEFGDWYEEEAYVPEEDYGYVETASDSEPEPVSSPGGSSDFDEKIRDPIEEPVEEIYQPQLTEDGNGPDTLAYPVTWDYPSESPAPRIELRQPEREEVDQDRPDSWYVEQARGAGLDQATIDDFLSRNYEDEHRLWDAYELGGKGRREEDDEPVSRAPRAGRPRINYPNIGGPGSPGVMQGPVQQVGQDPFSQLISQGYSELLTNKGGTQLGADIEETLRGIIGETRRGGSRGPADLFDDLPTDSGTRGERVRLRESGSQPEFDQDRFNKRFESIREGIERARRASSNSLRGELASRGLVSEPGVSQGAEIGALIRADERLAEPFATAVRDAGIEESMLGDVRWEREQDRDQTRLLSALQMATGLDQRQTDNFIRSLESGTQRQAVLSQIALGTLDRNIEWNKFLAQMGLERGKIMSQLQQGQIDSLLPLLQMFAQYVNTASEGYI